MVYAYICYGSLCGFCMKCYIATTITFKDGWRNNNT